MTDKKWHQITTHIRVNCVHFVGLVFLAVRRWSQLLRRRALSTKWPQIRGDNTTHATLCSPSFSLWYFKKQIQKSHLLISFLISSKRSEPWLLLEFWRENSNCQIFWPNLVSFTKSVSQIESTVNRKPNCAPHQRRKFYNMDALTVLSILDTDHSIVSI